MKHFVAPSLLSADFGNLKSEMDMINRSECDWLHIDIMDGVIVPNISFGFPVLKSVARLCEKPLDVHLMIVQPESFGGLFHDCTCRGLSAFTSCSTANQGDRYESRSDIESGHSCFVFDGYHRGCGHRYVDGCQSGIWRPDIYSPYIR